MAYAYDDAGLPISVATLGGANIFTGPITFSNATASTSTSTGAVVISGGLGVQGNIYGSKVWGCVWNDLADCIDVPENTDLEYGYCYCFDGENYYKSKFSELVGRVAGKTRGCGIYKITDITNEKVYIGQTRQTYSDRWRSHVKRGLRAEPATNNKLYNAMWEDGVENFTFEVLCDCKAEELNEKERYFIKFYKSDEWGYNSNRGVM